MNGFADITLAQKFAFARRHKLAVLLVGLANVAAGLVFLHLRPLGSPWVEAPGLTAPLLALAFAWFIGLFVYALVVLSLPLAILAIPFRPQMSAVAIGLAVPLLTHLVLTDRLRSSWSRLREPVRWLGLMSSTLSFNIASIEAFLWASVS